MGLFKDDLQREWKERRLGPIGIWIHDLSVMMHVLNCSATFTGLGNERSDLASLYDQQRQ